MVSRSTVRGGTRLTFDLVEGVTRTVEAMHETIARRPLPWSAPLAQPSKAHGHIAAAVYSTIRGTNSLLRAGSEQLFGLIPQGADALTDAAEIRTLGILNGVLGDHLEDSGNSLSIPMALLAGGQTLDLERDALRRAIPDPSAHVVVQVHGLCLSELGWRREGRSVLEERLSENLDCTTLHLRYNTGRHISTNGRELAQLLEQLCDSWPVELESLSLIGHSMGGLVIRSACWYADARHSIAVDKLRRVICLGTPHHGSMVERAGHAFDLAVRKLPYVSPLLGVGRHRSAGIKDLYHGDLLDEDWQDHEPDQPRTDRRRPVPLLSGVDYYFAAAALGDSEDHPLSTVLGDLLVRLDSATGAHGEDHKTLPVPAANCRVFLEKDHFDLITDERVHDQVVAWFRESA